MRRLEAEVDGGNEVDETDGPADERQHENERQYVEH
jgi:hypothetical protein